MIYIDFDGTLVDLWPRFYSVFCDINEKYDISFEEYKKIKLQYGKDEIVAEKFGFTLHSGYFDEKKVRIESKKYLLKDMPFVSAEYLNSTLSKKAMILTKRRNLENFAEQIDEMGIKLPYIVLNENISKVEWIKKYGESTTGIIVGDSIVDLEVGKLDHIVPYMVKTGLGTERQFKQTGIEYKLYENIVDVIKELK